MKTITLQELKQREYNQSKISNYKLVECNCVQCGEQFEYSQVKKFLRSRISKPNKKSLWDSCQNCWLKSQTINDPSWIKKNSDAQLISQNKPEQKIRNAIGVSKSWTSERRNKASILLKARWIDDEDFKNSALKNLSWTQTTDEYNKTIIKQSLGSGGLKGIHNNIYYDSLCELSYILYCEENNIPLRRYNLNPIEYVDENNQTRKYFPDFIINSDTVVEIKGLGLYYRKNYLRNIQKINHLKQLSIKNQVIFSSDDCIKRKYKLARRIHYENKK